MIRIGDSNKWTSDSWSAPQKTKILDYFMEFTKSRSLKIQMTSIPLFVRPEMAMRAFAEFVTENVDGHVPAFAIQSSRYCLKNY